MAIENQFLIITDSEFEPSEDFLMELACKLLDAKPPSKLESKIMSLSKYYPFNVSDIAFEISTNILKSPEITGLYLAKSRPLIVKLMKALYSQNTQKFVPNTIILSPEDPKLNQLNCSDSFFIKNTLYVRHPADATYFLKVANFHSYLLQDKRGEFVRLAASLGASEIKLINKENKSQSTSANISISQLEKESVNASLESKNNYSNNFNLSASFSTKTTLPKIPDNLRWFKYEPLWQAMAEARINNYVENFNVSFNYSEDFSINSEFVTKISGLGLSIGGNFYNMQRIDQEYIVKFFPYSAYKNN